MSIDRRLYGPYVPSKEGFSIMRYELGSNDEKAGRVWIARVGNRDGRWVISFDWVKSFDTREEAMIALDALLVARGDGLLTQEQFDRLSLLI